MVCPPIIAPCFYGIDLSTLGELFKLNFLIGRYRGLLKVETLVEMAAALGVDCLRFLDVEDLAETIGCKEGELCLGCVTGKYPTGAGNWLL